MKIVNAHPCHTPLKAGNPPPEPRTDNGFGIMEWGGVALAIILVLAIVLVGLRTLSSRTDTGSELTNIQTIIASTRGMMRASGGYGTGDMTPTLIKAGGVSRSMSTDANKNKLYNTWGGDVIVKGSGTNSFTVSYAKVPQETCINLITQIARGGLVNKINNKDVSTITATSATSICTADKDGSGSNTLTFTIIG